MPPCLYPESPPFLPHLGAALVAGIANQGDIIQSYIMHNVAPYQYVEGDQLSVCRHSNFLIVAKYRRTW